MLFLLLAFLLVLGVSLCPAQDPTKGSISGTVTDPAHTPVPGAKISLNYAGLATLVIESDAEGKYSVELVPGPYNMTVTVPNVGEKSFQNINLTAGKRLTIDVELEPPSAKAEPAPAAVEEHSAGTGNASITGTVVDPTSAVVVGAKAALAGPNGKFEAQSNDKGIYSLTGIPPGTYTLTVTSVNFAPKVFDNMTITPGLELPLDVSLEVPSGRKRRGQCRIQQRWQGGNRIGDRFRPRHAKGGSQSPTQWTQFLSAHPANARREQPDGPG